MAYRITAGEQWLRDEVTNELVGIKDSVDGEERLLAFVETNALTGKVRFSVAGEDKYLEDIDSRNDDSVPELEPLNWFPDRYLNGDGTHLYGHSATDGRDFVRLNPVSREKTTVVNPFGVSAPRAIRSVMVTSAPGVVLVSVGQASGSSAVASMEIWRSADYGATWSKVLTLGSANAGTINGIWTLSDRNFCEGTAGWYIGEYNVNDARVAGGANDAVTLWKSTDDGVTWTANQVWNTDGAHQVRHIHALKPVPGGVLICTGDTDAESALILWDEQAVIGNVAYASLTVPVRHGKQRYRIVDADYFDDGYLYFMGDGSTAAGDAVSDMGWFRIPADLSADVRRLDGKISAFANRAVYYSAKFSNGCAAYIEEIASTVTSEFNLGIWVTDARRQRIERAGCIKLSAATTGQVTPYMFQVGDTVYTSFASAVLGKGTATGTSAFTLSDDKVWNGIHPDTVHPVYWVDQTSGADNADAGRGYYPGLPWASLKYALESNRVVQGGRVILPAGDFEEVPASAIAINTDQTNAETTDYTTVEGAGMDTTKWSVGAAYGVGNTFSLGAELVRIRVKDIWVSTKRAVSTQAIFSGAGATTAQNIAAVRARIGGRDIGILMNQPILANIAAGGSLTVKAYDSEFVAETTGAAYLVSGDTDGPVHVTAYRSVFDGGRGAMNPASTEDIYAEDCLFTNYTVAAIRAAATATKVPATKFCRFHSFVGLPQWIDDGTLTEAGQWVNARCTSPLSPSALFDATSKQDMGAAPKDPRAFDYERSSPEL
jgi:hypothetical protein